MLHVGCERVSDGGGPARVVPSPNNDPDERHPINQNNHPKTTTGSCIIARQEQYRNQVSKTAEQLD